MPIADTERCNCCSTCRVVRRVSSDDEGSNEERETERKIEREGEGERERDGNMEKDGRMKREKKRKGARGEGVGKVRAARMG